MKTIVPFSLSTEEKVREFWEKNGVPKKARTQNQGKKKFYFMDGPPYASGHIHMGTALNKTLKDVAMRFARMQGFFVHDKPGYDTHGLPIENKVETKLGFKSKKEIEEFGVEKFVNECKKFATEFIDVMNNEFYDLGVWMDWKNPYLTLTNDYIEGLWWTFKRAYEQNLLYLGKYSVHVCPRCETAVAYNEIEYVKQSDDSVFVKFEVSGKKNYFLVIWTTTPWTLPANFGVMVNPKEDYVEVKVGNDTLVLAKPLVKKVLEEIKITGYKVVREFKGKELLGLRYTNPLARHLDVLGLEKIKDAYRVIPSEKYVSMSEGTGLVHCAPGHGKEDFEEGSKNGLPVESAVSLNGRFVSFAKKYVGKKARETHTEIIEDLKNENALLFAGKFKHDYPVCWRCKNSLLMMASPQWFFAITGIRERLKELNKEVSWVPSYGKARFANWLDSLGDWPVSRQRYWGTPLPIWICDLCDEKKVFGSLSELKKESGLKNDVELHKPWIDQVVFSCKCGGVFKRVSEVLDVWFDSGTSSWSSLNYPAQKDLFEQLWPADVNIEGKDQIRGWWNSQLITSTICFDKKPFERIVMHGLVLDVNRNKMSKSLGNIITPKEVIAKHNRDYLRHFLISESRGEDFSFDWEAFKDINRFYSTLYNVISFLYTYASEKDLAPKSAPRLESEDEWILSKLNSLVFECTQNFGWYDYSKVVSLVEYFLLEEVSRTYIQIIRDRLSGQNASGVVFALKEIVFTLLYLLAPISPHASEHFFQQVRESSMPLSVHLAVFPQTKKEFVKEDLEKEIALAKQVAQSALNLREEVKLRRRWPLKKLVVKTESGKSLANSLQIISSLSNVKEVVETKEPPKGSFAQKKEDAFELFLDTNADQVLQDEWELMELRRRIQDQRKQARLLPTQKVKLFIDCDDKNFLEKYGSQIEEETSTVLVKRPGKLEKLLNKSFYTEIEK